MVINVNYNVIEIVTKICAKILLKRGYQTVIIYVKYLVTCQWINFMNKESVISNAEKFFNANINVLLNVVNVKLMDSFMEFARINVIED